MVRSVTPLASVAMATLTTQFLFPIGGRATGLGKAGAISPKLSKFSGKSSEIQPGHSELTIWDKKVDLCA
jgi:hypothetical protein